MKVLSALLSIVLLVLASQLATWIKTRGSIAGRRFGGPLSRFGFDVQGSGRRATRANDQAGIASP